MQNKQRKKPNINSYEKRAFEKKESEHSVEDEKGKKKYENASFHSTDENNGSKRNPKHFEARDGKSSFGIVEVKMGSTLWRYECVCEYCRDSWLLVHCAQHTVLYRNGNVRTDEWSSGWLRVREMMMVFERDITRRNGGANGIAVVATSE